MDPKGPSAFIAEFVGTFFLVLGICGVVSAGAGESPVRGESVEPPLAAAS